MLSRRKTSSWGQPVLTPLETHELQSWEYVIRMEKPQRLFFRIIRMKGVEFSGEEMEVPIPEEMLIEISKIAETTRKTRIKELRNI